MPAPASPSASSAARVAIITGAGSGVGRAVALRLAAADWRLALAGRRQAPLDETARLARQRAHAPADRFLVMPTDVADAEACSRLVDAAVERFGGVDALINNAGLAPSVPIADTTPDLLRQVFAVNALGPAQLITKVWPVFERRGGGRIVNVSTIGVFDPFPGLFAYAGAKAALHAFTKSCATEGAAIGVKAFAVAPGAIETAMLRGIVSERDLPRARTLDPDDVARVIVACAVGERDKDNGQAIVVPSP